ncbi:MAG: FAD-dependent oxidoreductase, partial [Gemmatimonadota bacterium]|nr:FAD-dependent oxidoreductase [Gemmatimonadota bacterium]
KISAGSELPGYEARKVTDGVARRVGSDSHCWRSASLDESDARLELDFGKMRTLSQVHLTFDTGLSRHMTLTHIDRLNDEMIEGPQPETARDYRIEALDGASWNTVAEVKGNYLRKRVHSLKNLRCRRMRIKVSATCGVPEARIFEVRCYG